VDVDPVVPAPAVAEPGEIDSGPPVYVDILLII
jgi:hypothetical protein